MSNNVNSKLIQDASKLTKFEKSKIIQNTCLAMYKGNTTYEDICEYLIEKYNLKSSKQGIAYHISVLKQKGFLVDSVKGDDSESIIPKYTRKKADSIKSSLKKMTESRQELARTVIHTIKEEEKNVNDKAIHLDDNEMLLNNLGNKTMENNQSNILMEAVKAGINAIHAGEFLTKEMESVLKEKGYTKMTKIARKYDDKGQCVGEIVTEIDYAKVLSSCAKMAESMASIVKNPQTLIQNNITNTTAQQSKGTELLNSPTFTSRMTQNNAIQALQNIGIISVDSSC